MSLINYNNKSCQLSNYLIVGLPIYSVATRVIFPKRCALY